MSAYPCPHCNKEGSRVRDSREHFIESLRLSTYRRRRVCNACGKSFHTVEVTEQDINIMVTKARDEVLRKMVGNMFDAG
jgi:transcriptional regulator NrdR family protein